MLIMITNDDGVQSPGLLALRQALEQIAEIVVVAPERSMSRTKVNRCSNLHHWLIQQLQRIR